MLQSKLQQIVHGREPLNRFEVMQQMKQRFRSTAKNVLRMLAAPRFNTNPYL